jgi:hypothetical protein
VIIVNKKTIYIVVAVIVVILIVGVAGVMLLNNNGNGGTTTPTPTPAPSVAVSAATSIQFSVNETTTASGDLVVYQFSAKNLNTETEVFRVDMDLGASGKFNYIVDKSAEKSWMSMDSGATWTASTYATDLASYDTLLHSYVDKLIAEGDNTQDVTYTTSTTSIAIYCIATNPTLADSLFATS